MPRFLTFILHPSSFILLLGLATCAKIGDPRPPLILIPRHTTELTGMQRGEQVVLQWPLPTRNTDGTPVSTLQEIDVYRLVEIRADQPAPLSAEEFARGAQKIRAIPADEAARAAKDGKMTYTDDLPLVDRSRLFQRSFRYAVTFANDKKKTDGFSNYFFISPIPIPQSPVLNPPTTPVEDAIELSWPAPETNVDGSRPPKVVGFNIFRRERLDEPTGPPRNSTPITDTRYRDRPFEFGKTYYYSISVVANTESPYAESGPSPPVAFTPVDTFPPKPPTDVILFPEVGEMRIVWAANSEPDLAGYTVYRSDTSGTGYQKLNPQLLTAPTYKDTGLPSGKRYYYQITATDRSGNESGKSEEVTDTVK